MWGRVGACGGACACGGGNVAWLGACGGAGEAYDLSLCARRTADCRCTSLRSRTGMAATSVARRSPSRCSIPVWPTAWASTWRS